MNFKLIKVLVTLKLVFLRVFSRNLYIIIFDNVISPFISRFCSLKSLIGNLTLGDRVIVYNL